jgi:5'-AMP-activated protein kinase, catalytic alpha subunit
MKPFISVAPKNPHKSYASKSLNYQELTDLRSQLQTSMSNPDRSAELNPKNSLQLRTNHSVSSTMTAGNYDILGDLGEGTFGSVKLGKHITKGNLVAIKILEKSRIKVKADAERVKREIKILKKIDHPCFVTLYEIIENRERIYLIMEYASGGELFEHIVKKDYLTDSEACQFFCQIIDGIEYLHSKGIAH